jgi:redox-sensitive bicupin YhaK (pirin superfamily)
MSNNVFHAANTRGHANHGWLNTYHSFSFAGYHDEQRIHFGALRVLNDDTVTGGQGFGKHPHDNMEIISVVLDGALEHADTMGHKEALKKDEVQVMTAGTGLMHSEANHSKTEPVSFLQIWIFPEKRNVQPKYAQRYFDPAERKNKWQLLVSPENSSDESLKINQQGWIYRTTLDAGQSIRQQLHTAGHGAYLFVIDGTVTVNGQVLNKRDGYGISDTDNIEITAQANADVLLLEVPMSM